MGTTSPPPRFGARRRQRRGGFLLCRGSNRGSIFIFACRLTDESETTMDGWSRGVVFFVFELKR